MRYVFIRLGSKFRHLFQNRLSMLHISAYGRDEVRHEVVAFFELGVDAGEDVVDLYKSTSIRM